MLLARHGYSTQMHIGIRKDDGNLDAHAWLEYDGVPLMESDAHLNKFVRLPSTSSWPDLPAAP